MHALPLSLLQALLSLLPLQDAATDAATDEAPGLTQEQLEQVAREIESDVAALRGAAFKRPVQVSLADEAAMIDYMKKRIDMEYEPGELEAEGDVAKLLGLIPKEMDLMEALQGLLESQVGGYYDPDEDAFYLMERFADTGVTRTIISHELTHALDDQIHGIDRVLDEIGDNNDKKMAFHAVVEGSGTAIMQQWSIAKLQAGELSMAEMTEAGDLGLDELGELPEYIWKPMIAVYLRGQTFLSRTEALMAASLKPATAADIDAAFTSPPLSTEQVLHPAKYWDPEQRDDPLDVHLELGALPEGWTVSLQNTLGEMALAMVCTPADQRSKIDPKNPLSIMGVRYTNEAAEGWGGDSFALLSKGEAQVLVGATMWDTIPDATEFSSALTAVGIASHGAEGEERAVFYHASRGIEAADAERLARTVAFHIDG